MGLRPWRVGLVVSCVLGGPAAAAAQLPPVGVPGGLLRLELNTEFTSIDRRFRDGTLEGYGADFASPALGRDRLPFLADIEANIAAITGMPAPALNLGRATADALVNRDAIIFGLSYGITDRLTVFGRWPLVRVRTQAELRLDPAGANAGINPADPALGTVEGAASASAFFTEFDDALAQLQTQLDAGQYDADPERRALAEATLASGTALRGNLFQLLADPAEAAAVLPTAASTPGTAIVGRVTALQGTLATELDVPGFTAAPTLPTEPLTADDYAALIGDFGGPIAGSVRSTTLLNRGDAELGAAYTLVDRWNPGGQLGSIRAVVDATVRLPTGIRDSPDHFLDIGTGDGQTDVEVGVTADLGRGTIGARLTGRYVRQLATTIPRRVSSPAQPLVPPSRLAQVRWDPGDGFALSAAPFLRLARTFAVQGTVAYQSRGDDVYNYSDTDGATPAVPAAVLGEGSGASATTVALGLTYANPGRPAGEGGGLPLDAGLMYRKTVTGSGGRVPAVEGVQAFLRLYWRPF